MNPYPRVSIILATYNERENIRDTIQGIFRHVPDSVEVIVVDDDSPDNTWHVANSLGDPRVKVIRRIGTRGLASAFNRGVIESRGEIVGWMDADMSMPPSLLPKMIEKLKDYDIVIGSRYAEGAKDDRAPLRVYASWLINRLAGAVLGYGIRDYDSGFVVLRRTVFNKVSIIMAPILWSSSTPAARKDLRFAKCHSCSGTGLKEYRNLRLAFTGF